MIDSALPNSIAAFKAARVSAGRVEGLQERAAVEVPFELRINGRSHTLLMVSPVLVEELALGMCLSEGLVSGLAEVQAVELGQGQVSGLGAVLWANVVLPAEVARRARVRRVAPAATSCGLCGLESLGELRTPRTPVGGEGLRVEMEALFALFAAMEAGQEIFAATGGTHAAGLGTPRGELLWLAEDVGRHNALDKVIGLALKAGQDLVGCVAALSGRLSYEMALKSARAGIPLVASVSAPTSLGLELMQKLNITLVGFLRGSRATVYTHPRRVCLHGHPLQGLASLEA